MIKENEAEPAKLPLFYYQKQIYCYQVRREYTLIKHVDISRIEMYLQSNYTLCEHNDVHRI